jgi:hypothetical protein
VAESSQAPLSAVGLQLKGDAPLETLEGDEFGLTKIVEGLSRALATRISADGFTLGIEGAWGSGKSTLANFIVEELREHDEHVIIRFEPWLIGDKNALISAFLGQLASQIEIIERRRYRWWHLDFWRFARFERRLSKNIRKYGEYMGALAVPVGSAIVGDPTGATAIAATGLKAAGVFSRFFGRAPSLDQLKSEIVSGLHAVAKSFPHSRFTVIIDDTDRLESVEAMELLRLVRKVADFPLVTYLICFDADVLSKQSQPCARDTRWASLY